MKHWISVIFFGFCITSSISGYAQSTQSEIHADTTLAESYFGKAKTFQRKADFDSSTFYFETAGILYKQAGEVFRDAKWWEKMVDCINNTGINYQEIGQYDLGMEYMNRAMKVVRERLGKNHIKIAYILDDIGIGYFFMGDYDKVMEYFNRALDFKRRTLEEYDYRLAVSYNNIGMLYDKMGDLDHAIAHYQKSLDIKRHLHGEIHVGVANTYHNFGNIYHKKGEYIKSLEYYEKALRTRKQLLGEDHPYVGQLYNNMGKVYQDIDDPDNAMDYFQKSLELKIKSYGEENPNVALSYQNIGLLHLKNNDFKSAHEYMNKALSISIKTLGADHSDVAVVYTNMAKIFLKQNRLDDALEKLQMALMTMVDGFDDLNINRNPSLENVKLDRQLLSTLSLKASAIYKKYESQSGKIEDLDLSFKTYTLAIQLIDQIRNSYKAEGSKLFLGEIVNNIYPNAVEVALNLFRMTGDNRYALQAFAFTEKSKSGVLMASLQEAKAKHFSGIPPQLLEKEKTLRRDLTFIETRLYKAMAKKNRKDSLKAVSYQNDYFMLKTKYQQYMDQIERDYPSYYDLKYRTDPVHAEKLRQVLDKKTALINYCVGDSLIYAFIITNKQFDAVTWQKSDHFNETIKLLCRSIRKVDISSTIQTGYQAYSALIEPISHHIHKKKRLIIIPQGILHKVPFDMLLTRLPDESKDINFTKLDYLIKDYEITTHYSATLYSSNVDPSDHRFTHSKKGDIFTGFAPVFSEDSSTGNILTANLSIADLEYEESDDRAISVDGKRFNALEHSEEEVRSIIQLYKEKGMAAKGYLHAEATEENFKAESDRSRILHVATHGIINENRPALSALIFSQYLEPDDVEDGILYAGEAYNLDLNADLVVLSSCESGIGKLIRGEGLMALTRGFLYSGASNLIVSLWKVSDRHTSELMVELYKQILSGKNYSDSLRQAKLKMLKNESTAFPKSWSGFVFIGN